VVGRGFESPLRLPVDRFVGCRGSAWLRESPPVRSLRPLALAVGALAIVVATAIGASAQSMITPSVTPTENTGGWVYGMAFVLGALAFVVVLLLIVGYMRFAPRFAKDEETSKVVRADRVLPGQEPPRRTVDLSQAVPIVVQPPAVPAAVGAAALAAPAPAAATAPVAATPPAAAPPAGAPPAATPAPPAAASPAAAPASPTPEEGTSAPPAAAPDAPAGAAPPPAAAEHADVTMDQETYDAQLAELLSQGTDRRIAEGRARRAAMIAARKKAAGEA
jgi:hypothetical protein